MYPKIIYKDKTSVPRVYAVVHNEQEEINACAKMGIEVEKECPVIEEAKSKKKKKAD